MSRYTFHIDESDSVSFEVDENSDTSDVAAQDPIPEWMALDNFRCDHCSLPAGSRESCPAVVAIWPLIAAFCKCASFETVEVAVEIRELEMRGKMSAQKAVRSLMGLVLALSSCPTMQKLRPMARFHLPFGSKEHTAFRYLGMYLTAQHLRLQAGKTTDWELSGLQEFIREIHKTNQQVAKRIRQAAENDAVVNSLVFLDALAMSLEQELETSLDKIKPDFFAYLE